MTKRSTISAKKIATGMIHPLFANAQAKTIFNKCLSRTSKHLKLLKHWRLNEVSDPREELHRCRKKLP